MPKLRRSGLETQVWIWWDKGIIHKQRQQFFWIFDTSLPHVGRFLVLSIGNFDQFFTSPLTQLPTLFMDGPKLFPQGCETKKYLLMQLQEGFYQNVHWPFFLGRPILLLLLSRPIVCERNSYQKIGLGPLQKKKHSEINLFFNILIWSCRRVGFSIFYCPQFCKCS